MGVSDQARGMSGVVATVSSAFGVAALLTESDAFAFDGRTSLSLVSPMAACLTDCDAERAVTDSDAFSFDGRTMTVFDAFAFD